MKKWKTSEILRIVISLPKTIYVNMRLLPFKDAIRLPLIVAYDVSVKIKGKHNSLKVNGGIKPFMMFYGIFKGSEGVPDTGKASLIIENGSTIELNGRSSFQSPCSIRIDGGHLLVGDKFSANKNLFLSCSHEIHLGERLLLGWNVEIRDNDGHTIFHDNVEKKEKAPVVIGNHCWICSHAHILKGTIISDESVIGYKSLVHGRFDEANVLIAGHPAGVVQRNIRWKI